MSDTADDDPDGFDREAEREKLREKYERDQERREATQQMSELLLKGATMTNQHCDDCGSPIFRMDGEAFCPSCGGSRALPADGEAPPEEGDDAAGASPDGTATTDGETAGRPADGTAARADTTAAGGPSAVPERTAGNHAAARDERAAADAGGDTGAGDRSAPERPAGDAPAGGEGGPAPAGHGQRTAPPTEAPELHEASVEEAPSLAQAKASLRRAIVSLSEQAAQTDDPGRATQHLGGAREAAEALAALDGVRD